MPKIFTEKARSELSIKLLDAGFAALKKGGLGIISTASCSMKDSAPRMPCILF